MAGDFQRFVPMLLTCRQELVHWKYDFSHLGVTHAKVSGGVVRKSRFSKEQITS
jgi:hypothetical protein